MRLLLLLVLAMATALAAGRASTAASPASASAAATTAAQPTAAPSRSARVETVTGDVGEAPRPTLSRAAVMAAARAAVAARAVEAARLAGAAGARLALAAAAPALRAGGGGGGGGGGRLGPLVLGPVESASEPRCASVSSAHYSLDMLLGTWYVVEVISPVSVGTVCDGFQLTKLNVSRAWEHLQAEAVIMSRFGRLPGGPTVYFNRTMLVGGGRGASSDGLHEDSRAPMLYDQLAVTDYSPGGRYLSVTACREGRHWTYVYGRRPAPAAPDELRAMHARLAAAGVALSPAASAATAAAPAASTAPTVDDAENDASGGGRRGRTQATEAARDRTPPPWWPALDTAPTPTPTPAALPVFNVTECGW